MRSLLFFVLLSTLMLAVVHTVPVVALSGGWMAVNAMMVGTRMLILSVVLHAGSAVMVTAEAMVV